MFDHSAMPRLKGSRYAHKIYSTEINLKHIFVLSANTYQIDH